MNTTCQFTIGIDEAGRGPLAGPVAVGAVLIKSNLDWSLLPEVTDSKKLSEKKRDAIYEAALQLDQERVLQQVVTLVPAVEIDRHGIMLAIRYGIEDCLRVLQKKELTLKKENTVVLLDGSLKAPVDWKHQKTIIKGDALEKSIGLASILAKVCRDRYMYTIAGHSKYMMYDFPAHKGYGTKKHREAILQYGFSDEHRQSYCKNIKLL